MPRSAALARLLAAPDPAPADALLLRAFETARSDAAFEELVRRYGPMVLAACRRALGHAEDAEDAFQAVFLVLARKAGTVRGNLAGWLYAVAVRTARGVRIMRERRRKHEARAGAREESVALADTDHDLAAVIDEELARLPGHYRDAVVLCELRGLPRKQAAAELGIPEGTLSGRLAVARRKLAARLSARGMGPAVPAALLAPVPLSAGLVASALSAARGTAGPVANAAAAAVVKAMFIDQLKVVALAAGILLAVACGGFATTGGARGEQPASAPAGTPTAKPSAAHAGATAPQDERPKNDPKRAGQLHRLDGHTNFVTGVAFFPTGNIVVTSGFDSTYRIWDAKTGAELHQRSTGQKESQVGGPVAVSPDGKRIAARYFVSEADTGKFLFGLEGHAAAITRIRYDGDGKRILTASYDSTIRIWQADTGEEVRKITAHPGRKLSAGPRAGFGPPGTGFGTPPRPEVFEGRGVRDAAFSPDGTRIVSGGIDGMVRMWDADTGKELWGWKPSQDVLAVAFLPGGKQVASGEAEGTIRVWDAVDGKVLKKLTGHTGGVDALAVVPDGRLVSAGADKTVRVWDVGAGKELRCFHGHTAAVSAVAVSPDGRTALTGGNDNTARLWALPAARE
ncbi:MAG TPA: sigma-70 family RNA polymerase sigma factor [Urbifossiella sp.]|jgi:RNA polymerase sigma factor (sigma-70 family)|nr:sigma-70 family RNA polymerase sigma factor [Urbifossiella sp.]